MKTGDLLLPSYISFFDFQRHLPSLVPAMCPAPDQRRRPPIPYDGSPMIMLGSNRGTQLRDAIDMDKHVVIGAAIGMFGFAALGLIAPFLTTRAESDLATAMVYGAGHSAGTRLGKCL